MPALGINCRNDAVLLREITCQGYRGGVSNFCKLLAIWRQSAPSATPPSTVSMLYQRLAGRNSLLIVSRHGLPQQVH
jgi:hypothetical protein